MKRRDLILVCLSFVLILSLSFVSAGWFSFNKKITGEVIVNDWTNWMDRDGPSGSGDYEDMTSLRNTYSFCENPIAIECQTTSGLDYTKTYDIVSCSLTRGLVCKNDNQADGRCDFDYKVRFNCGVEAEHDFEEEEEECTNTCASLGYECGNQIVCSVNQNCGSCVSGKICQDGACVEVEDTGSGIIEGYGTYTIHEGDKIIISDVWASWAENYTIDIYNIDLDPRNDSWYEYYGEPRVYFGGRGVGLILHGGDSGRLYLNPVSSIFVGKFYVHSIDVDSKSANVTFICIDDACMEETENCTDSDITSKYPDGKNYFKKGHTKGINEYMPDQYINKSDYCWFDGKGMMEGYCASLKFANFISRACPNGCVDGACVEESNETEISCTDSDVTSVYPDGLNYYLKGNVTGAIGSGYPSGSVTYSDYCLWSLSNPDNETLYGTNNTLIERYCGEDYTKFTKEYECQNGCEDGACVVEKDEEEHDLMENSGCEGCLFNEECFKFNFRESVFYCDLDGKMDLQKDAGEFCLKDFECLSNKCEDGKCSESNFIQKIIQQIKKKRKHTNVRTGK